MIRVCESRCPKCGHSIREERSHFRCERCGIVEACCEGAETETAEPSATRRISDALKLATFLK
jgi:hypothetical protein